MPGVMRRPRRTSGVRIAASTIRLLALFALLALLALVSGCDSTADSQAGGSPTGTTPATAPVTTPPSTADTPTAPPIPTYTSPPSRNLERPPGFGRVPGSACDPATTAAHFFAASWAANAVSYVQRGAPVPAFQWADAARVLPGYRDGVAKSRSALLAAGVPRGFVVFQDLADADAAMREGIAAAKARADSRVLAVYIKVRTAHEHLVESCGALE
jgi:hypothetical protein